MSEDRSAVPHFSGDPWDYTIWSISFLAKAKAKSYEEYLLGTKLPPTGTAQNRVTT